jgi:hypothetical protein
LSTYLVNGVLVDVLFKPGEDDIVYCQKIKIIVKINLIKLSDCFCLEYLVLYLIIVLFDTLTGFSENIKNLILKKIPLDKNISGTKFL